MPFLLLTSWVPGFSVRVPLVYNPIDLLIIYSSVFCRQFCFQAGSCNICRGRLHCRFVSWWVFSVAATCHGSSQQLQPPRAREAYEEVGHLSCRIVRPTRPNNASTFGTDGNAVQDSMTRGMMDKTENLSGCLASCSSVYLLFWSVLLCLPR